MNIALSASDFRWIIPEITVTVFGLLVLLLDGFKKKRTSNAGPAILTLVGTVVAFYFTAGLWDIHTNLFSNLYVVDNFGTFLKLVFLAILFLVAIISLGYAQREELFFGEYYALLLFGVLGMMVMVSSNNFITIFIGLEVMSLSIYILCGLMKGQIRAVESSLKYFLLGSFATAFFLYGIALIFAATGTIDIQMVKSAAVAKNLGNSPLFMTGIALLIVGFGFKIATVPFHMWTPDVYEGAPTSITAYMATGVKAAAFGAFLRVFYTAFYPFISEWSSILWFLAVLTMSVGNIIALVQNNMKRLLAYSSIAHAGYILIAFVTGDRIMSSSVLFYLAAYTFMNLGAFTIVILLGRKGEEHEDIDSYAGLASRHPFIALCMTIFLLSLTGIPPLAGFAGKFYLFSDAIKGQYYWLGVIGMLNSSVAAYYYLRVLMYMYFKEPVKELGKVDMSAAYVVPILISVFALLYMGILPRDFLLIAQKAVAIFQ
ncbi:MAG: NADH-quinone oxidoreductase subunit N [Syntrophorhabdaceae bacterium PtaU1.Bin034]|nr:MAG: NADH-quinone oxidoreductase subunit N [Syntrophorhabdaceae bacterium PtaU1.Bin034]